jgi:hypothetical protein
MWVSRTDKFVITLQVYSTKKSGSHDLQIVEKQLKLTILPNQEITSYLISLNIKKGLCS